MYSHKNIKVRSACYHPVQLPGLIIFVHGVNSEGEWYDAAEENICNGLNKRLHLPHDMKLKENIYSVDKILGREINNRGASRSPVIRFYWGYSAKPGTENDYQIPLRNLAGEDYHELKKYKKASGELAAKGPWYWGGGPFQNGCNQLVALWSDEGFNKWVRQSPIPFSVQFVNSEFDRLLAKASARHCYAHAARRLADLLNTIRNTYPKDTVTLISHSSLPLNPLFMRLIVAYDLPVGICESSDDKSFLEKLRRMADWLLSDSYFRTCVHPEYMRPADVCAESAGGISPEEMAEIREIEARSRY